MSETRWSIPKGVISNFKRGWCRWPSKSNDGWRASTMRTLNRDEVMKVWRLGNCENFVGKREDSQMLQYPLNVTSDCKFINFSIKSCQNVSYWGRGMVPSPLNMPIGGVNMSWSDRGTDVKFYRSRSSRRSRRCRCVSSCTTPLRRSSDTRQTWPASSLSTPPSDLCTRKATQRMNTINTCYRPDDGGHFSSFLRLDGTSTKANDRQPTTSHWR